MNVDLTSDDEGGFNGEDGDEEVVFVEPVEPPKAGARAPGGQQGLAQIMQSAKRKRDREEERRAEQPGYNKLVTGVIGGKFVLSTTRSPYMRPEVNKTHHHIVLSNITLGAGAAFSVMGSATGGAVTTTTTTSTTSACGTGAKGKPFRSYHPQKAAAREAAMG